MIARGKVLTILEHARVGMDSERPPIRVEDVAAAIETPEQDDGRCATIWRRRRTVLVYYEEVEDEVEVRSVSATRRRLAPKVPPA